MECCRYSFIWIIQVIELHYILAEMLKVVWNRLLLSLGLISWQYTFEIYMMYSSYM